MDELFVAINVAVVPFWLLMIFAPGRHVTRRVMSLLLSVAWLPVLYVVLVVPKLGMLLPLFTSPPSLEPVARLLGSPDGAFIGWVHFLAFDLFVGRWIYLDARTRHMPGWVSALPLFLTLMLGPLGLLTYLLMRGQFSKVENQIGVSAPDGSHRP